MKLFKLLDLNAIGTSLYKEGSLSRTSRLESQGYDLETEVERKVAEDALYKENNISDAPSLPYSSPQIGSTEREMGNGGKTNNEKDE
jgi:hypothetical protein